MLPPGVEKLPDSAAGRKGDPDCRLGRLREAGGWCLPGKLADFILFTQRSCILNLSSELNEGKVSYPQFFLLTYLASEDFLSMSSIAQKMGHSTAAATGMVDKLQEMGYLKRMSAAKDRRKIMVAITQEGRDLVARMRQNIVRDLAALMAGADPDARQTLADTGKSIRKRRLA